MKGTFNLLLPTLMIAFLLSHSFSALAGCEYSETVNHQELPIGNVLVWSTSMEMNNSGFNVQRSLDGEKFENIGNIPGNGTSNTLKEYRFLDTKASIGNFHYRLEQVDFDGSTGYSKVIFVERVVKNDIMISEMTNTTVERIFEAVLESQTEGILSYAVIDVFGETVKTNAQPMMPGENVVLIDMSELDIADYKVIFQCEEEKETITIRKRGFPLLPESDFADTKLKLRKVKKGKN